MLAKSVENARYRLDCKKPNSLILILYFSLGYIGIFLYSPSLPNIASFFKVSEGIAQFTMVSYLLGYALSQLFYGPFSNRFGRKKAISFSILLGIVGSLGCVSTYYLDQFFLLVVYRFFQAFGMCASVCMTFTLINDFYYPTEVKKITSTLIASVGVISYLIAVWIGGYITTKWGWVSCFWAMALYGILLFFLTLFFPETSTSIDVEAMKFRVAYQKYKKLFRNRALIFFSLNVSGLAMLLFYYVSAAPFISHSVLHFGPTVFGEYSILNAIGFTLGGIAARVCLNYWSPNKTAIVGLFLVILGTLSLLFSTIFHFITPLLFFVPSSFIWLGQSMVFPVITSFAQEKVENKALGAALMICIYVSFAFLLLTSMSFVTKVTLLQFAIILIALNIYIHVFYLIGRRYV